MFKKTALAALANKLMAALDPVIDPIFRPIRALATKIRNKFPRKKAAPPLLVPFRALPLETKLFVPNSVLIG